MWQKADYIGTHTHTHTPEPRKDSFLLGLSPPAPSTGKVQHLTVQGTMLRVRLRAGTGVSLGWRDNILKLAQHLWESLDQANREL